MIVWAVLELVFGAVFWAAGSVALGALLSARPATRGFGRQTAAWGAIDGGIAAVGARNRRRRGPTDPARLLIRYARDRWLYAFGLRHAAVLLAQTDQQVRAMQAHYALPSRVASMLVEPGGPWRPDAVRRPAAGRRPTASASRRGPPARGQAPGSGAR